MRTRLPSLFGGILIAALALAPFAAIDTARAADKVHAAKAAGVVWTFTLLNVGIQQGIFAKYGLDVDTTDMAGDAKLQQGLLSGTIDFGLGSGPSMALAAKGGQAIATAAFAGEPRNVSMIVGKDSPIKTVADLKGKRIGTTTKGSLTEWLVQQLSRQQGWGDDGLPMIELGTFEASVAAMKVNQVDAVVGATEAGYLLDEKGEGHVLMGFETVAPLFHTHVVFARTELVKNNPDLVKRFLQGIFASIAFMKENKEKTTEIATQVLHQSPAVMNRTWDYEISMFEDDGHFNPQAIDVLQQSFVAMGLAPEKIPDDKLYTTQFLPVKP
ncbi:MAG TPA: ABC transporter substrate-binding protein [Stellaceae bacterium]|jgi:ABC-type nitrate/sulfonate/bicarbonate transport system substrate-binding protein